MKILCISPTTKLALAVCIAREYEQLRSVLPKFGQPHTFEETAARRYAGALRAFYVQLESGHKLEPLA